MPESKSVEAVSVIGNTGMSRYDDDQLHEIKSFQDAFGLLGDEHTPEDYSESYGTGFTILSDKSKLVGEGFVVIEWRFSGGSYGEGSYFVSMMVVTEDGKKWVVNDGSTGICDQMRKVTENRIARGATPEQARRGLLVRGGLSESKYEAEVDGKLIPATTYYLAN